MKNKIILLVIIMLSSLLLVSCGGDIVPSTEEYLRIGITSTTIEKGKTNQIVVSYSLSGSYIFDLEYDETIVNVSFDSSTKTLNIEGLNPGDTTIVLSASGNSNVYSDRLNVKIIEANDDQGHYDNEVEGSENIHYLIFEVDGVEVARIIVLPTDTYDSLEPYFPTIKEKTGYDSFWERVDEVYVEGVKSIVISAYYYKKS